MSAKSSAAALAEPARKPWQNDGEAMALRLDRIFSELDDLRGILSDFTADPDRDAVWEGVNAIQTAISSTRGEMATLHAEGMNGAKLNRATDELDAVVVDTEAATETILSSAEMIDDLAGKLSKALEGEQKEKAELIHEQAIRIFEACNFQDITGQRIKKTVSLLKFIETRIHNMMSIWSSFADQDTKQNEREGDAALLNGPALASDDDVVSQDDIDSLFP